MLYLNTLPHIGTNQWDMCTPVIRYLCFDSVYQQYEHFHRWLFIDSINSTINLMPFLYRLSVFSLHTLSDLQINTFAGTDYFIFKHQLIINNLLSSCLLYTVYCILYIVFCILNEVCYTLIENNKLGHHSSYKYLF